MKLGVLADLHWRVAPQPAARWHAAYDFGGLAERCAATVDALAARGCDVLVVAGDLTHDGDPASCKAALDCLLGVSPIPVAVVDGNHDVRLDRALVPRRTDVRDGWARARALAHEELVTLGAMRAGGDGRWGWDEAAADGDAEWDAGSNASAGRSPASAADGLAAVVVSHFPLVPHAERLALAGLPWPGELPDRSARLAALAATRVPTVVLSGHVHVRDAICHDNVLQLCVPALVERPHEAAVVELDPIAQSLRCVRVGGDGPAPARGAEPWLLAPADERWSFADGAWTRREAGVVRHALAEA